MAHLLFDGMSMPLNEKTVVVQLDDLKMVDDAIVTWAEVESDHGGVSESVSVSIKGKKSEPLNLTLVAHEDGYVTVLLPDFHWKQQEVGS